MAAAGVIIPSRFNGPPDSGNGGYACGVAASAFGGAPATVALRLPPPLDRELRIAQHDDHGALYDGDDVVAEVQSFAPTVELPSPIDRTAAMEAADRFDVGAYTAQHPFPTCFTCGPARPRHDGLEIFPAPVDGAGGLVAWPWQPSDDLADDDGHVAEPVVWAALDCPSGLAWMTGDDAVSAAVLGSLGVVVHRRPAPGEALVVAGWRVEADGRKRRSASVIWGDDGEVLAVGEATWIVLRSDQHDSFRTSGTSSPNA